MPCVGTVQDVDELDYVSRLLCLACRKLDRRQLLLIRYGADFVPLLEWYAYHLVEDLKKNFDSEKERKFYLDEGFRVGLNFEVKIADGNIVSVSYQI